MKPLALLAPLALAACGQPQPMPILPPAELATCANEPTPPELPGKDQQAERDRLTLDFILNLRSAGNDCRSKVHGLATWMESMK